MRKPFLKAFIPTLLLLFCFTVTRSQQVVISQVYGGGGNTGATFTHDFIELFNRGNTPVSLSGWSVQYASSGGNTWAKTDLTAVTLQPGQYYLVQEAQGAGGTTPLPTPDVSGTIAMSATAGKVVLVNFNTVIPSGTICPATGVIDFVGFGPAANCSETSPTAILSNTTAAIRGAGGCTDANNNNTDFAVGAPTPRNTSTPLAVCGAPVTTVSVTAGITAAEPSTNGTFTVTLSSPAPAGGITITYSLSGTAGSADYTDPQSGSVTIAESATSATITLVTTDDSDFEGTESIDITLTGATSPYTLATASASINLNDNDAPPTVSVAAGTAAAEPATDGTFTLTLSSPAPSGGITVTYTLGGTATAGSDYNDPLSGSITIPAATNSATITIDVTDDPDAEPLETVTITLNTVTAPFSIATGSAFINLSSDDFAPIAITNGIPYVQDFNSLAISGTTNSLSIPGWQIDETGNGARDNELYAADNGNSNTGDTYSYGSTGSGERALGSLLSGSLVSKYGAYFINQTGTSITSLRITYTGEQWRLGTAGRADRVDFQYSLDATGIANGNWVNFDQLDLFSPVTTVAGLKDGNLPANRTVIAYTINGLNIPAGSTFFIRFQDTDGSGADDGLAIDDLTVEANPVDNAGPAIVSLDPANGATNVALGAVATITFDEDLQAGTGNIYVKRSSDNTVVQTVNIAAANIAVNKISFTLNVAYGTNYYVEMDAGVVRDINNNDFTGITGAATWAFITEPPPPPGVVGTTYSFDACTTGLTNGFTQYSTMGDVVWTCTTFGRDASDPTGQASLPNGVQINGFANGTNVPNVDWFISPPYDLTGTTFPLLSFWSRTAFNGLPLELMVSVNYNGGDPTAATWTPLNGRFPQQTSNVWTLSSDINLSAFKQPNVHFAFVYTSSDDDGARWTLDDITVINSAVPPPPSLTVSTTDIQFTYVASGSSADKTFTFTGNDLTSGVELTSNGAFSLSKDGSSFSGSLSYTVAESNNIPQTVYVRFSPALQNQTYSGNITVTSGGLEENISVSGSSIDPQTTLEVVNWNIEWFGSPSQAPNNDNQQEQNVRTILQSIGADVYALTEIVDEARLASVVSSMPGYAYVISNYGSHTNTTVNPASALGQAQKLAFIYKTSVISNVTATALLSQGINSAEDISNPAYNYFASGRFPYMMSADVTLNCVTRNVKFILVHAKANTSPTATSYDRRKRGADTLHFTLQQDYANDNIIILGDYNDDLDVTITAGINPPVTSYSTFINDPGSFTPVTLPLSLAGKKSTVSYNDVIDHAMISNEMAAFYMPGSAAILTDVTGLVSNYGGTTSDHYPVFHRYVFPNTNAPQVSVCPVAGPFCGNSTNQFTIPEFVVTDDCDQVIYSYTITGATQRSGNTNNASGSFNPGISYINWTATDSWGNTATCQTVITVNTMDVSIPDAFAMPMGVLPNTVYIGYDPASSLTLVATPSGGAGGYSYLWTGGATTSSITVSPAATTVYTVTVMDANNCQATASKTVTVMDIRENRKSKKVYICHKPDAQNASKLVNVNAVQGHLDHGDMLGMCVCPPDHSRPAFENNEQVVSVDGLEISGYPNPSSSGFTLVVSGIDVHELVVIRVTDMQGRLVEQRTNIRPNQSIRLGERYGSGTYFAEVSTAKEKKTIKLIKL